MQRRPLFWFVISLLSLAGAIFFWHLGDKWEAEKRAARLRASAAQGTNSAAFPIQSPDKSPLQLPGKVSSQNPAQKVSAKVKSRFPYRLSNTSKTQSQLLGHDKAILLANALIDTANPVKPAIPDRLRASANSGSYVVQASGPLDDHFRAMLAEANATIVSYIPNNAYLVRVSDSGAQVLSGNPLTQSVIAYEPYYKLDTSLLALAMEQASLPPNTALNVTAFPDAHDATLKALQDVGAIVVGEETSTFGTTFHTFIPSNILAEVASFPGVQLVSKAHPRLSANDLSRTTLGVSADSIVPNNYLGLTGSNVLVNINDSGVDATHPDLTGRVFGDIVDNNGHGTHVAGTILGSGTESSTVTTNAAGSVIPGANFRGMAPNAQAYSISIFSTPTIGSLNAADLDSQLGNGIFGLTSDTYLQEQPALTNALISNNSWNYDGSPEYDVAAASYDAAVRDALPGVTGPQPVLFVFSAGNAGGGNDDGTGGNQDTILSPATAKNVITVGAIEQLRNITNIVLVTNNSTGTNVVSTNTPFLPSSDSGNQVASFSSRGNVGIDTEGPFGRFKPDLVTPGTFVISDRSSTWDEKAYYNPTNYASFSYFDETVDPSNTNGLTLLAPGFPIPDGMIQMIITIKTNLLSTIPLPPLPIYITVNNLPTTNVFDFMATNQVFLPTNSVQPNSGDIVYIGIGDSTNQPANFNVQVELIYTNNIGDYFQVLSNLNDSIGTGPPFYYRYESGTSMSAAGVSGMLACMQEFFQQKLQLTNSPALMKALLINGARDVNTNMYDFNVANTVNSGGWGLPNLPNTIPPSLANASGVSAGNASSLPILFFDQSLSNALATGQSKTRVLTLAGGASAQPLRVTLVWTDPPGNPAAGVKLVNNLVLIVTNLDTGDVFYGNDIPGGSVFNQPWDTNGTPNIDLVNNVQNIYLAPPLGTNYSITVTAQRVNVNAVTGNTNSVVQDYALVISSGDAGAIPNPFAALTEKDLLVSTNLPVLTNIVDSMPLFNQRVGANPQAAPSTNGVAVQWNFYVYTNTVAVTNSTFTNVAFITFLPPELALPRMGAFGEVAPPDIDATRFAGADIDLYASTDPSLTNLNPVAIANSQKSVNQVGNEAVTFTNSSANQVYYIGVKSEDQQGGQFDIMGFASNIPFSQTDSNGDVVVSMHTLPAVIPGGTPPNPGNAFLVGVVTQPAQIRKVVVTDTVASQNFADYIGTLNVGTNFIVLNNHSPFTTLTDTVETFTYDDSGEGNTQGSRTSDGPGSLINLVGLNAGGQAFLFYMVNDSSLTDTGQVQNLSLTVSPQPPTNKLFQEFITPMGWFYDFVDVPPNATNLTISVNVQSPTAGTLGLYVRRGEFPTTTTYDQFLPLTPGGTNSISITEFDSPPLNPGRYYYGIFNPTSTGENVFILVTLGISVPTTSQTWLLATNMPMFLPDDAVTNSPIFVGVNEAVADVQVGVRINHPRESDLVLTLISPEGTRVLLSENRGGLDTNGYGSGINTTNVFPQTSSGTAQSETNTLTINTNGGLSSGTLIIDYDMFTIPDDMRVYYNNALIFDSGLVSFTAL